jgi:hypothetical protein
MVSGLFSGFSTNGGAAPGAGGLVGGDAGGNPQGFGMGGGGGIPGSDILGAARFGTSAVSALSGFALANAQANALDEEAGNETIAARGDYVQAQQKNNQINQAFNQVIGRQLATASAGGVDIGSGSVIEAGRQAEQQRDRVVTANLTGAQTDAAMRTAQAQMLAQSASVTRTAGLLGGIAEVAKAGLSWAQIGGGG